MLKFRIAQAAIFVWIVTCFVGSFCWMYQLIDIEGPHHSDFPEVFICGALSATGATFLTLLINVGIGLAWELARQMVVDMTKPMEKKGDSVGDRCKSVSP